MKRSLLPALLLLVLVGCGSTTPVPRTFTVGGPAMQPTFVKGDTFTIHDVDSSDLKVGDIVLFKDPGGWLGESVKDGNLLKRILGVGGDTVRCDPTKAGGKLVVDGKAIDESAYLPKGVAPCDFPFSVTVPDGHLWMLGDNRFDSADSRAHMTEPGHGFVSTSDVEGIVIP